MIIALKNKALWAKWKKEYRFGRIVRKIPDWLRRALVVLVFATTTILPALALAGAAGAGAAGVVSRIWSVPDEHPAAAVAAFVVFSLSLMLIMPLIKAAWSKMHAWDHEISISKGMEG